jgi:two-component system sensor histidine kinase RegB
MPTSDDPKAVQRVDAFIDNVRERFQLLRPTVNVDMRLDDDPANPHIAADASLQQAVLNLLNNAADVSPHSVDCSARCTTRHLVLDIRDRGTGFVANGVGEAYEPPNRTSSHNGVAEGMGMGLLLANATIERLGGSVHIADREGGGAWVQVTLPLAATSTVAS